MFLIRREQSTMYLAFTVKNNVRPAQFGHLRVHRLPPSVRPFYWLQRQENYFNFVELMNAIKKYWVADSAYKVAAHITGIIKNMPRQSEKIHRITSIGKNVAALPDIPGLNR